MSPARRRRCIDHTGRKFGVSERSVCRILGQHRSTQRKVPKGRADDAALTADIIEFATRYGRDGYPPGLKRSPAIADRRRIAALLRGAGWLVNVKRVERIRRLEGLKVSVGQPKRSRFWLNDGSCVRLRPEHPNPVWSYDVVEGRPHDGQKFRMPDVIDQFTRECLCIRIDLEAEGHRRHRCPVRPLAPAPRTPSDHARAWAIVRRHPPWCLGRLCHHDPLRRPPRLGPTSQPCIDVGPGDLTRADQSVFPVRLANR